MWGCSSIGRAFDWQSKGRGFESPQLHHSLNRNRPRKAGFLLGALAIVYEKRDARGGARRTARFQSHPVS